MGPRGAAGELSPLRLHLGPGPVVPGPKAAVAVGSNLMKLAGRTEYLFLKFVLLAFAAVAFVACSADPNARRQEHLDRGKTHFQAGDYDGAMIEFQNAAAIEPPQAEPHHQLARTYLALGDVDAAYQELTTAVGLDQTHADAQLQLATLLIARGELDAAQKLVQSVLTKQPRNAKAHAILGAKRVATNDLPGAIAEFQKAVDLDPKAIENYGALGAAHLAARQPDQAEKAYKAALEANPRSIQAHVALGQFYFSRGDIAKAEVQMRAACDIDLLVRQPRLFLAQIYVEDGNLGDAEKVYTELKVIAPDDPEVYAGHAQFYRSTGQAEKAATELRGFLRNAPDDNSIKSLLVETLLDLNRAQEAEVLNKQVLTAAPADPRGLLAAGRLLLLKRKHQQALTTIERSLQEGESADGHYYLGVAQTSLGMIELAKDSFARALALNPESMQAALDLSALEASTGQQDEALRLTDDVLSRDPKSSGALLVQARARIAQGKERQGEELLQEVLNLEPDSLPALTSLLALQNEQGKTKETLARITRLTEQYPRKAGLHFLLAVAYFGLRDLEKAEDSVTHAISLDAQTPAAYTLLASIDLTRGAVEKAKKHLRKAIEANPDSVTNYMALKDLYERERNWEEVKKLYEQARKVDPASPQLANDLAYYYLEHGGDVEEAVSLAQIAKQKMPASPVVADTLGWAYYKSGRHEAATLQLKESVRLAPDNPVYRYHLGMAYRAAGEFDLARGEFRKALDGKRDFPYAVRARVALNQLSEREL
jgi:tetratricopeptide (TPR) repeat protein